MPVIGTSNLPVAPRSTPWNPKGAAERVFEACGGNVACIQRAFLYRRRGTDARDPGAYSLPFCDVIDGRLHIIPKGIAACAGRGQAAFDGTEDELALVRARITSVYDRVRSRHTDWPASPFAALTADASGTPIEGVIAMEGVETGDGRFIAEGALYWDEGPVPLKFDNAEMDHSGATIGTVNVFERREGGVIWGIGNLSVSSNEETQALIVRAEELFAEAAVGVSMELDHQEDNSADFFEGKAERLEVSKARIRAVAIVDTAAFAEAKVGLVAAIRPVKPEWFADPEFGSENDERLVWQEPDRPEEERQLGCPFTITDDGRVYGHAALWGRCHVGYPGTCLRPPKDPAAYRNFLTGERLPGVPTGPLVMRTAHASMRATAEAAEAHYAHTGAAVADVAVGADRYGIWVAGALRSDATPEDIEILRGSALSGDWRYIGGHLRLVGLLVVNAPGFRVARAMAASAALLTVGPGCEICEEESTLEERVFRLERLLEEEHTAEKTA